VGWLRLAVYGTSNLRFLCRACIARKDPFRKTCNAAVINQFQLLEMVRWRCKWNSLVKYRCQCVENQSKAITWSVVFRESEKMVEKNNASSDRRREVLVQRFFLVLLKKRWTVAVIFNRQGIMNTCPLLARTENAHNGLSTSMLFFKKICRTDQITAKRSSSISSAAVRRWL